MQAHIQKWGNSLGLRIPIQFAKQLKLHPGSSVILEVENGQMTIKTPKYDLNSMLDGITKENLHHELFDEAPKGNEEW